MIFHNPVYLDIDILSALSSQFGIEVSTEITSTARSLKSGTKGNEGELDAKIVRAGGTSESGSESEHTETRTSVIRPTAALNKLLDILSTQNVIHFDPILTTDTLKKGTVVEVEGEWAISPTTDIGALLRSIINLMASNPELAAKDETWPELIGAMFGNDPNSQGKILLTGSSEEKGVPTIVAVLDSSSLLRHSEEDDLEGDLTIFGLVDKIVPEGKTLQLDNYLLAGIPRRVRRLIPNDSVYEIAEKMGADSLDENSLAISGPVVVLSAIAVYP